ncbi:MAG: SMC-Scp complex subunit ScpB [Candidatus Omnitrophica bacterium]|nr:SMC-Scp complex subunit ScpB [Candidatus Omnitrophota bacterium]
MRFINRERQDNLCLQDSLKSVIEALLFSSDKPLLLEQIKSVLDIPETGEIRRLLEELKTEYENSCRGIRLVEIAGGFQMIAAPDYVAFLKKLHKERRVERLSKAALETLAIVAYKQPLTKLDIESLRGVDVDGVIKGLLEKNLIRIVGRRRAPGKPYLFGTTRQFLEYFGLKSLAELPKIEDFSQVQRGPNESLISLDKNSAQTTQKEEFSGKEGEDGPTKSAAQN